MSDRAVGIVRVSQRKGREGESFVSPGEQRDRIQVACKRDDLELVEVLEEIDVSGGAALAQRAGLRQAIELVENGGASVLVVAYFDRLVRSLRVQGEVVSRVEAAGGRVLALDIGAVTEASAAQWLSGTMIGAVSEYYRRSVAERAGEAQARAVARGVMPWNRVPPGYRRDDQTTLLVAHEPEVRLVRAAFQTRAEGGTIRDVQKLLRAGGVDRSFHGVQALLGSRVVLGEIHFGRLVNLNAHEPIVDRKLWDQVQARMKQRGPRARSDRLLARLGVLRCGTCDARMTVGSQTKEGERYADYRCPTVGDCPRRVAIAATIAEQVVVDAVLEAVGDERGAASAAAHARHAAEDADRAQAALDAAVRAFTGLDGDAAVQRLGELRQARDRAVDRAEHLGGLGTGRELVLAADWPLLTVAEKRAVIRAAVVRAVVVPAAQGLRGAGRIRVELRVE